VAEAMAATDNPDEVRFVIERHKESARIAKAMAGARPGE
jgi:hypothetical protein